MSLLQSRPRRVLLVDDHVDSCELYHEYLSIEGHDVRVVHDGSSAIELLLSQPFDVAVIDIGLPGMDGYEVARRLRERGASALPLLVAMTGYASPDPSHEHSSLYDIHLMKPVAPAKLATIIAAER
jgi:two-component system, OmpR family, response regulator